MKELHYQVENDCLTVLRMKFARFWHGPERKTFIYSVAKGFITFPEKEKVSTILALFTKKKH